jgi:hypothetical protein
MPPLRVNIAGPDEAELWCGDELLAVTVLYDGRLHLRIAPRADGRPWLIDATGLTLAVDDARAAIMPLAYAPDPRPTFGPRRSAE